MNRMIRGIAAALAAVLVICGFVCAYADENAPGLEEFPVRFGDRTVPKVAITMDDVNETEWVWKAVELCEKYGITMTFFPNGINLHEEDRENWQRALDAGCEIGSHANWHDEIKDVSAWDLLYNLGMFQEQLDRTLGYHYEVRWFRPPFGSVMDSNGSMRNNMRVIKLFGYDHILNWDVSYMKDAPGAFSRTQNGSILLFHARHADYICIEELIPMLLEAGYEPVTVSELFGFDPPETGEELYVYNPDDFRQKD